MHVCRPKATVHACVLAEKNIDWSVCLPNRDVGTLDMDSWTQYNAGYDAPHQENGHDCGVFTALFAMYRSLAAPFDFTQAHIAEVRR